MAWEDNGRRGRIGCSSSLRDCSILDKSPFQVGWSEVQGYFNQEEGASFGNRTFSKSASLAHSEIGTFWMLYIVQVASF